jgi:hypothetical protein
MQAVENLQDVFRNAPPGDGMVAAIDDDARVVGCGGWDVGGGRPI